MLVRPGHTEAATDLTELAGLAPAGALCEIVNDDGSMARLPALRTFARRHRLALISIADLIAYRRQREVQIRQVAAARLPLPQGDFQAVGYMSTVTNRELIALVYGDIGDGAGRAGPGAFRMPDRRRPRLAALRLRSAVACGTACGRTRGSRRGALHPRS